MSLSFSQTGFIDCLPLFVHMFWESHAIVQSYAGSCLLIRWFLCVRVCVCMMRSGEAVGIRDPHIHAHSAHTDKHCYLIHVWLLHLRVVHYITDSYQKKNSTSPWRTMRLTNKGIKAIFVVSQHTDCANFLFPFKGLQFSFMRSYCNTKTTVSTCLRFI